MTRLVNPSADVQGSTYNQDQSKTTIGSGGLWGKGLFLGPQTNLAYVPEQHTAAFVRIGFFAMLAERVVMGLAQS